VSSSNDFLLKITPKRKSILFVYVLCGRHDVFMCSVRIKHGVTSVLEKPLSEEVVTLQWDVQTTVYNFYLFEKHNACLSKCQFPAVYFFSPLFFLC
jgi:FixJ family two-component response regulator